MTSRHGWILNLIVGALVLLSALRLLPTRSQQAAPCHNPVGIQREGLFTVVCAQEAQVPLHALLAGEGLTGCAAAGEVRRGEMVKIEAGCKVTREPLPGAMSLVLGIPLDINRATVAELILLPSIGPVLAARIVKSRLELGRFGSLQELARVRGIGPRTVRKLRSLLRVTSQSRIK